MPDLDFQIMGVAPATNGLTPLLHFELEVTNRPSDEAIRGLMLNVQIQIQAAWRRYDEHEQDKLSDLFGPPEEWDRSLGSRLWTYAQTTVAPFTGRVTTELPVPCTYDLNVAATKYFYALDDGDVPLTFVFNGSVFYATPDGRMQIRPIDWDSECTYRMPLSTWQAMMDAHYPDSAWLYLQRDAFERLYAYRRRHGLTDWNETLDRLLPVDEPQEVTM